jgi:hypothetical protein
LENFEEEEDFEE